MANAAVATAVEARLAANWTACPIRKPNDGDGETPADGSAFLAVQYPVARERQVGLGGVGYRTFREEGAFRLVYHAQRGQGLAAAMTLFETLRNLFRAAQFDGVNCLSPSPAIADDSNDDGNYFRLSTAVPYYFDFTA